MNHLSFDFLMKLFKCAMSNNKIISCCIYFNVKLEKKTNDKFMILVFQIRPPKQSEFFKLNRKLQLFYNLLLILQQKKK